MEMLSILYNTRHVQSQQSGKWPTREDPASERVLPLSRRQRLSGELDKKTDRTRVIEDSLSLPREFACSNGFQPCINVAFRPSMAQ